MEIYIVRLKCVTNAFDGCTYLSLSKEAMAVLIFVLLPSFAIPPSLLYTYVYIKNFYSVSTVGKTIVIAITCTKRHRSNYYVTYDNSIVANGTKTTTAADDMIRSAPQERNKEQ